MTKYYIRLRGRRGGIHWGRVLAANKDQALTRAIKKYDGENFTVIRNYLSSAILTPAQFKDFEEKLPYGQVASQTNW